MIRHLGRWYGEPFVEEATVLQGSIFGWLFGVFGQHAVTINRTVHLTPRAPDLEADRGVALLGHECFPPAPDRRGNSHDDDWYQPFAVTEGHSHGLCGSTRITGILPIRWAAPRRVGRHRAARAGHCYSKLRL